MSAMDPVERPGIQDCWNQIGVYGDSSCSELINFHHCRNCPVYKQAGRTLLERESPSSYRSQWTEQLAAEKKAAERGTVSVVLFRVGMQWLALATQTFKEVSDLAPFHRIPHRINEVFLGLVQIRGELQLCVAIDKALGMDFQAPQTGKTGSSAFRRLILAELEGHRWVWAVDEVFGVVRFVPESLNSPSDRSAAPIHGVFLWQEEEVLFLDEATLAAVLLRSLS
jgi:chemotaxis-related protein WspD